MFNAEKRLGLYKEFGFIEKAFNDEYYYIRLEAYRQLGFTKEAFDDKDWRVRLEAKKILSLGSKAVRKSTYKKLINS